ncbi:Na+/H+ antiporter subunit E [Pseudoxanthomonas wuyuanensis]|uniref:Multisubunit potassium/proton antiporter, PhaE subunit n=1 Tax=Pseudoxanthomonas wuyuanensis TaxID=1073196 RepID=A0A286D6R7_9GAMM|nr:Na+/H+ antiporter subunit E [Pseudoxanthomonas wuyuanensis]KAF1719107.1 Na+/H+ antiporter subunit E [Pseudoxanthomonas wuyuanensis]SOD54349.1 multisubunit potassium/proton antiporter, PhaE subunit [Pseudoxanthomonas wuyuanensis]
MIKRLFPSPLLSATVFVFWLLMVGSVAAGQVLLALLLAIVMPLFAARLDREFARIGSLRLLPKMMLVVGWDIVISNIEVARRILGPESAITPDFIWVPLDIRNIHGIAALTSIITLTPGTVSAELSPDRRYLLVHCFNLKDADAAIAQIKRRYEAPLMEIFP